MNNQNNQQRQIRQIFVNYIYNMNQRYIKQRISASETPVKRSESSVHVPQYFWKPNQKRMNKNQINIDIRNKQNIDQNIVKNVHDGNCKDKFQHQLQGTPKKKVIHLKSLSRNSKSKKGNSGSVGDMECQQHTYTQVTDFSQNVAHNSKQSLTIQIDLMKQYQRSTLDTISSIPKPNNYMNNSGQFINCHQHFYKKATFLIKGQYYCDKCAVPFITKGFVVFKIGKDNNQNHQFNQHLSAEQNINYIEKLKIKQQRNLQLNQFVDELDKTQPMLQKMISQLSSCVCYLQEHCRYQEEKIQQNWKNLMVMMSKAKQKLYSNLKTQQQRSKKMLEEAIIKVKQQTESLSFMRSDITHNINEIMDQKTVSKSKFEQVMNNFVSQLDQIDTSIIQINSKSLILPKVQFDLQKFSQEINKCLSVKSIHQCISNTEKNNGEDNLYHLSFGKEIQKVQSPTFKVI